MGVCYSSNSKSSNCKPEHKQSATVNTDYINISDLTIKEDINNKYNFFSSMGKGTSGLVREALDKNDNQKYAIKTLLKSNYENEKREFLKNEIDLLLELKNNNPHIISCHHIYEDRNNIHMIFDWAEGGDLFDYMTDYNDNKNYLTEKQALHFFIQILDALHYLYIKRIVHRDVKLENFLIVQNEKEIILKLIDFGFATKLPEGCLLKEQIGSPYNIAPEILLGHKYDFKVDIWAAGIMLYNMISGRQPFSADSEEELAEKILKEDVLFIEEVFQEVSSDCKDLIRILLSKNPEDRPSAFQAKNHRWIQKMTNLINAQHNPTVNYKFEPKSDLIQDIVISLNSSITLKKEIFSLMLSHFEIFEAESSIKLLRQTNNKATQILAKSTLTYEKVLEAIKQSSNSEYLISKVEEILKKQLLLCKRQRIDYNDFFNSFINGKEIIRKERIWNIFKNHDTNNGFLKFNQIQKAFEENHKRFDLHRARELLHSGPNEELDKFRFDDFMLLWDNEDNKSTKEIRKTDLNVEIFY